MKRDAIDELYGLFQNNTVDLSKLDGWCEKLEQTWSLGQQSGFESGDTKTAVEPLLLQERLIQVSADLRSRVLDALQQTFLCDGEQQNDDENLDNRLGEIIGLCRDHDTENGVEAQKSEPELNCLLRVSKNFLRWYLQIYPTIVDRTVKVHPIPEWKSMKMLELYLALIEKYCQFDPVLAQHAAQLLFYASYNPVSGSDAELQAGYQHLIEQDHILSRLLACLTQSPLDVSLTLSLVRNVHNIVVSFPKAADYAGQAVIESVTKNDDNASSWLPEDGPITFRNAFPLIVLWALQLEPAFPGPDGDKRAELVVEILRTCYVLRLGSVLSTTDGPLWGMILSLVRLDPTTPSCDECRCAAIPLLMDTSGDVADYFLSHNAVSPLLAIWEAQVSQVVDKQMMHDGAAALLTPILVVLHKFCNASADFCESTKLFLFPPAAEEEFQNKLQLEIESKGTSRSTRPLVPPPVGSLQEKMIQLLTWPQSHIKRFAGELLWVLCDSNAQLYIARVGMGNAVVLLGSKGLIQIPGQN